MFNILLVDDEPIVKIALRTMIDWDSLGFPICGTASDGIEALALVKELEPDIIITDLKMPNMNGLELIRELNNLGYKGKIIVASNFGEYELVREALLLGAVDYMLKISIKTEGLIEQLQKTAKLLQEQQHILEEQVTREQVMRSNLKSTKNAMLKDFFTNNYYKIDYFLQNQDIQLYLLNKDLYQFYINLDVVSSKEGPKNNISISFIENMILDLMESEHDVEVFQVEINAIIVLVSKERLHQCQFEPLTFVHKIEKLIQMYMTIEPIIVYSYEVCDYTKAREMYQAYVDAININFYEEQFIINSKDIALKPEVDFVNYVDFTNSLIPYLYEDDKVSSLQLLSDLIQQCKEKKIHPYALKTFIAKCLDYIPLCDQKISVINGEQYQEYKNNVLNCNSSDKLLSIASEALEGLSIWSNALNSLDSSVTKKEVAEVINFIGVHYRDKITLQMIADHVNFSENYLCRVFRDQMGVSLIHYLNHVRMNKAAELIMKGHTYVKEISTLVGISDQFYFSRMFKKHFGVSPTDYKSHVMQSNLQKKTKSSRS